MIDKKYDKNIIIFRAYGGEPVRLCMLRVNGNIVDVAKEGKTEFLSVRQNFVHKFDNELYDKLCLAYSQNDQKRLDSLWSKTEPYEPELKG